MMEPISKFLDRASNFFAHRKGLLPVIVFFLVVLNLLIRLLLPGWLADTDLFLHLGIILTIIGMLLAWAL